MNSYQQLTWIIFALFALMTSLFLHRLPGLMGDEASEGENVFELLESEEIVVTGERSYIGPAIDYIRVPFVWVFGYSALALRVVMLLFSVATFWLAASVLRKSFGEWVGLIALSLFMFSPIYLTYQRLGWAITLFPFFAFLILWILNSGNKYKWLLIGLVAGLGLANHIIFLPTLVGLVAGLLVYTIPDWIRKPVDTLTSVLKGWPAIVGFWAGFGMQFVVLLLNKQDQGNAEAVMASVGERLSDLMSILLVAVSGSSFVARYTGTEFSPGVINLIFGLLVVMGVVGLVMNYKSRYMWAYVIGLDAHLLSLVYVIDRFTLRYFVVFALGVWLLAGVGVGSVLRRVLKTREKAFGFGAIGVSALFSLWFLLIVVVPFLSTGGSTNDFSLGNRTNSAAALVDERSLIECLREVEGVHSENVHIWNRLQYLSHEFEDLNILEEEASRSSYKVHYRWPKESGKKNDCGEDRGEELCSELKHFCVVSVSRISDKSKQNLAHSVE